MRNWSLILALAMCQAHMTHLVVNSQIFRPVRELQSLKPLLNCPVCIGFWIAATLSACYLGDVILGTLVVAFLGGIFYEAKQKYLPCKACEVSEPKSWKVI